MAISSRSPFKNRANIRRTAGTDVYQWKTNNFEKKKQGKGNLNRGRIGCDNTTGIDNNTTYVFEILPNGNHLAYVDCDYVE